MAGGLEVLNIFKSFGGKPVLRGVSFAIAHGQISALLGPSGCGKSTLLSLIAGLEAPDQGQVRWDGADLTGTPPHRRGFGLMFQEYALFPHLNVFDNIAFGLHTAGLEPVIVRRKVQSSLELVGLSGFDRRDASSLSGGEQQRVALARSLAPQPRFLMLDEPLGALDHALSERLLFELRSILGKLHQTALYVTHDQSEAFALADEVILLNQGQVEQRGTPQEIFRRPASPFAARFLGLDNLIEGRAAGLWAETAVGRLPLPAPLEGPVTLLLRPDAFQPGGALPLVLQGVVSERIFRGGTWRLTVQVNGQAMVFDLALTSAPSLDEQVVLSADPLEALVVYRPEA